MVLLYLMEDEDRHIVPGVSIYLPGSCVVQGSGAIKFRTLIRDVTDATVSSHEAD